MAAEAQVSLAQVGRNLRNQAGFVGPEETGSYIEKAATQVAPDHPARCTRIQHRIPPASPPSFPGGLSRWGMDESRRSPVN
jgi:hypothetical protein